MRAEAIVLEMQKGLNREIAPGMTGPMSRLYDSIYRKLVEANINKDLAALDDALRILGLLRETWALLIDKLKRDAAGKHVSPAGP